MRSIFKFSLLALMCGLPLMGQVSAVQLVGSPRPITPAEATFMAPSWSPDNVTLAVTKPNHRGIYLLSAAGNDTPLRYGNESVTALGAQWSSEGDRMLVYLSRYENHRRFSAIGILDVLSDELVILTDFDTGPTGAAIWSTDQESVHILKESEHLLRSARGAALDKQAAGSDALPLYYLRRQQIMRHELASGDMQEIDSVPGKKLNLALSPDGSKMAFEIIGGNLWVANIDGSHPVDLGRGHRPSWSPDGAALTFQQTTDDGHQFLTADIIVVLADGAGRVNITAAHDRLEMNPAWSPDGRFIAYDAQDTGRIYVQEVQR